MDLAPYKVIIAVFGMPECGACEEFIPEFAAAAHKRGRPFHVYEVGKPIPKSGIPVFIYDLSNPDQGIQEFATRYNVESTPTVVVMRRGTGTFKVEGTLNPAQIDHVLTLAHQAHEQ